MFPFEALVFETILANNLECSINIETIFMICIFEITSIEVSEFKRIIHIADDQTFEKLHEIIQNAVNFDQSQLASFYITDDNGRKKMEITSLDTEGKSLNHLSMRNAKLCDTALVAGQRLIYVFDFFNERFFYLILKEKLMKNDLKEPFVSYEKGNSPAQFLINDYDSPDVELLDLTDSYRSLAELEDYYEIFGEMDV